MLGRRIVAERSMRPLLVIDALEVPQPVELLLEAARRRRGGIAQERQVQALEPPVLLRLAGGDVSISSSPGKGARVDFAIPLGPSQT